MLSAIATSSGQVTLRFSRLPRDHARLEPELLHRGGLVGRRALGAASACASRPARNICGVCASQSCERSSVDWILFSETFFTVSTTGSARIPPTSSPSISRIRLSRSVAGRQGRAASCTSIQSSASSTAIAATRPLYTESRRVSPPQ